MGIIQRVFYLKNIITDIWKSCIVGWVHLALKASIREIVGDRHLTLPQSNKGKLYANNYKKNCNM